MTNNIKISIVMPVYNQEKLVIRALQSIPEREDIEVIISDDGSTDKTRENIQDFINKSKLKITLLCEDINKGIGYALNKCYDNACGEYIVQLDSDDYFITENFIKCIEELDGITDFIFYNYEINSGKIWDPINMPQMKCGNMKFIKRSLIGQDRCPEVRIAEDWHLHQKLLEKNPTEKITNYTVYHYNWPRKGSLCNTGGKNE